MFNNNSVILTMLVNLIKTILITNLIRNSSIIIGYNTLSTVSR